MPPVVRKQQRLANGQTRDKLSMQNPVNICPMCKMVVPKLYPHVRGRVKTHLCKKCIVRF